MRCVEGDAPYDKCLRGSSSNKNLSLKNNLKIDTLPFLCYIERKYKKEE